MLAGTFLSSSNEHKPEKGLGKSKLMSGSGNVFLQVGSIQLPKAEHNQEKDSTGDCHAQDSIDDFS